MTTLFLPHLVNGPTGDPALYVRLRWERRSLIFDLGDLAPLSTSQVLRISHAFVSHAHMDHFFGFDRVLRFHLPRPSRLHLFGPAGMIDQVKGRLSGYTWNLTGDYPFELTVTEVAESSLRTVTLPARSAFAPEDERHAGFDGTLLDEPLMRVECAILDHAIPSLAFALQEKDHVHIDPKALERLGLRAGEWLREFKTAVREGWPDDRPMRVEERGSPPNGATRPLGELRDLIARVDPGARLAYVTDAIYSEENAARIVALARNCDLFYCEAMFMEKDAERAAERYHLTAAQAGTLARRAGVQALDVFHVSPRYSDDPEAVILEAQSAFRNEQAAGAR
jgi:ribonuclease Z